MVRSIVPFSPSLLLCKASPSLVHARSTSPHSFISATARMQVSSSPSPIQSLQRRSVVVAGASVLWATIGTGVLVTAAAMSASMVAGKNSGQQASLAVKRGMELFAQGDVTGSLAKFDEALELDPRQKPYLWQRGLSLYYLNRFEEGAAQFREDVAVNPNDTEESIWCFLCEAQIQGVEEARKQFLEVGQDRRPVMRRAYELFKNGGKPDDLIHEFKNGQPSEVFYAHLYAGLYHESEGNSEAAKRAMLAACRTRYGIRSGDYMASLAKVHCECRNWDLRISNMG